MLKALSIFSGGANIGLAEEICDYLEVPLGRAKFAHFSDGETYVEIQENVRGVNCFVVQPTCQPVNEHLMELLVAIDALRRSSAGSIIAIIPYYGYARQDRKTKPRTPITAKLVADLISAAGTDRLLAMDLHAGQIQGFFNQPVNHLTALPILADYFAEHPETNAIVASLGPLDSQGLNRYFREAEREPREVYATTFDTSPEIYQMIQEGYLLQTIDQQPYTQGFLTIIWLYLNSQFAMVPGGDVFTNAVVDQSNVDRIIELTAQGYR